MLKRLLLAALLIVGATPALAAFQQGVGICETTTTTGQGTLSLAGAYTTSIDYLAFSTQITTGNTVPYTIESSDGKFEHGLGVWTDASPDTLTRASEIVSSDGVGTKLTLPAGTHFVCLQSGIDVAYTNPQLGANLDLVTFSLVYGATTILSDSGGTTTLSNIDVLEATTESTIEAAIDTLANLTSIQSRTVTLADAGANAFFGWDDTAGAYENLTNAEAEAIMEPLIDTLANLTSVQGLTITLTDAGADAVWGWDDSANAYENLTGAEVAAAIGDNIALTTNTTGNYVKDVADGTGIDGTAAGEGATYTPTLDLTEITPGTGLDTGATSIDLDFTEISSATWGAGSFTTFTFDAGATDPLLTFGSGTLLIEAVTSLRQADAANAGGQLKWLEDPGTGSNFISILAPASITSDVTCTLENDSNPIPDSCVGDGTDSGGSLADADYGDITVSSSGTVWDIDPTITVGTGSTITWTFNAGATDPVLTFESAKLTLSSADLYLSGGLVVGPGSTSGGNEGDVRMYSADDSANGPELEMHHDDPSADAADIPGSWRIFGGADDEELANLVVGIIDPATGTEDISWGFSGKIAGALTQFMIIGAGVNIGNSTNQPGTEDLAIEGGDIEFGNAGTYGTDTTLGYAAAGELELEGKRITMNCGSSTATTSGDDIQLSAAIPANTKVLFVNLIGVSISGTDDVLVVIGDSGGYETSGYTSAGSSGTTMAASGAGFLINTVAATENLYGLMTLSSYNSLQWGESHCFQADDATDLLKCGGGQKATSATTDRVRLSTSGSNTFDLGSAYVCWGS